MLFILSDYALFFEIFMDLAETMYSLSRFWCSVSFGVSVYPLRQDEHYPYYAYEELKEHMNMLSKHQHKLGRLFFRLANFWQ